MKKLLSYFLLSAMLIVFSLQTHAQQFSLGIKVAGNASNYVDFSDLDGGVDAGLFFRFGNRFYFQPEVNYSFRSTKLDDIVSEYSDNVRLKQHFLDIPMLLGYHFIYNENFRFHLLAGPRVGVRVGSNISEISSLTDDSGDVQFGIQVGLGIDFWRFTLDARYDFSANKISQINQDPDYWKQNMIILSLGFKFIK